MDQVKRHRPEEQPVGHERDPLPGVAPELPHLGPRRSLSEDERQPPVDVVHAAVSRTAARAEPPRAPHGRPTRWRARRTHRRRRVKRIRIRKERTPRRRDRYEVLPLDPRDPDILRASRARAASADRDHRSRSPPPSTRRSVRPRPSRIEGRSRWQAATSPPRRRSRDAQHAVASRLTSSLPGSRPPCGPSRTGSGPNATSTHGFPGGRWRARTSDLRLVRAALSRLS